MHSFFNNRGETVLLIIIYRLLYFSELKVLGEIYVMYRLNQISIIFRIC
jgi:hypothetical protein